jgi:hypothetical protein
VNVSFKFPHKLGSLPAAMNKEEVKCSKAVSTHTTYGDCSSNLVYAMPMSCQRWYVGQTSRCLNERLTEHLRGIPDEQGKHKGLGTFSLNQHIKECCSAQPEKAVSVRAGPSRLQREILEAAVIQTNKSVVISSASIKLQKVELKLLKSSKIPALEL